ncbi:MAG: hypothetical protein JXL85_02810 [Bacilli bacterium]|nr:hypothetical protein [Bacilli bacterium]
MKAFLQYIKSNILVILSVLLFGLSAFFAYTISNSMGYFNPNDQTLVGTIYISNYEESQYQSIITSEIIDWKDKASFNIIYQNIEYEIDLNIFDLDLDGTISAIVKDEINDVLFNLSNLKQDELHADLDSVYTSNIINHLDWDTFLETLNSDVQKMNIFKSYALEDFLEDDLYLSILDSVTISNINPDDVTNIIALIDSINIQANSRFSLLSQLSGIGLTNNQLSILASGIQKITNNTPFTGYIFVQNNVLPDWAGEGMNVRLLQANNYDFSFYNELNLDYTVNVEQTSSTSITLSLVGYPFVADYSVSKVEESSIPYSTIYTENLDLDETTVGIITIVDGDETTYRLLVQDGVNGKVLSYVRTTILPDSTEYTQIIYREIYYPTPEVYEENTVSEAGS